MPLDRQHKNVDYRPCEVEHRYGKNVHILNNPYLLSVLTEFCSSKTTLPLLNTHIEILYSHLLTEAINCLFPRETVTVETRMKKLVKEGVFEGDVVARQSKVVCVNLARAGSLPTHVCFNILNYLLNPELLRQDHFYLNRKTNAQGMVVGVDVSGSKIGGDQDGAFVIFADPMGATGGSLSHCIGHYKEKVAGKAKKYIALNLIITPEYVKRMQKDHQDLQIFALRLDRGLSSKKVLESVPGTFPDEEIGLSNIQYIVPGAGGVGEILNNSFV